MTGKSFLDDDYKDPFGGGVADPFGGSSGAFAEPEETDPLDDLPPDERAGAVLNAAQLAFKERARKEQERFELATDSEYWACVCFQSREQKEQFLKALNLPSGDDKYIDGWELAKALGIKLDRVEVPYNPTGRIDKTWLDLT